MASPIFASTPISRRNRRRQHKLKKRKQHTSNQPGRCPQSREDTETMFDPNSEEYQLNAASIHRRPQNSNPFSLLDVSIPSPTLSVSSACHDSPGWNLSTGHDLCDIEGLPASLSPTSHLREDTEEQVRQDEWALSLQQNTAIVRSDDHTRRRFAPLSAYVESPRPMSPKDHKVDDTAVLPAVECEESSHRVPSPLLYHRRSEAKSSEPMNTQTSDFTPPSPRIDRYAVRHIEHLSEARDSVVQRKSPPADNELPAIQFIAARLPLMGSALSSVGSEVKNNFVKTKTLSKLSDDCTPSTVAYTLPILTTTNTYIFPKRVYNAYCQPSAAWSGPSCMNTHASWKSSRNLKFPKLSIPGHRTSSKSSPLPSDTELSSLIVRYQQIPPMRDNSLWLKTSLPVPLPEMFDSRCRSSTQDSFDSKFNVLTATKQIEHPTMKPVSLQQPLDCSNNALSLLDTEPEKMSVSVEEPHLNQNPLTESAIEWLQGFCQLSCVDASAELEGIATPCEEEYTVVPKMDEDLVIFDLNPQENSMCERSEDVWFEYHAPYGCVDDDMGSEVHVDINDAQAEGNDWAWDDHDDWETAASTPATEVDSHLGPAEHKHVW